MMNYAGSDMVVSNGLWPDNSLLRSVLTKVCRGASDIIPHSCDWLDALGSAGTQTSINF